MARRQTPYPWPSSDSNAQAETGGNTRLLICEQDDYKTRKGENYLNVQSKWLTFRIRAGSGVDALTRSAQVFGSDAEAAEFEGNLEEGDWYYNNQDNVGFREYRNGEWHAFEIERDAIIGLHTPRSAKIFGKGNFANEAEARKLFDDYIYDPYAYTAYEGSFGHVFYDESVQSIKTIRGNYETVTREGSRTENDIFYVIPRVVSLDISETTENIPVEFMKGSLSADKAQAGAHTFGNGLSIAASEEGLHLFLRTIANSKKNDIEVKTRRIKRKRGTVEYREIPVSSDFYLGEYTASEQRNNLDVRFQSDRSFYWNSTNQVFFYADGVFIIANTFVVLENDGNNYLFAASPYTSEASWATLNDFIDNFESGLVDQEMLTVFGYRYIIRVEDENKTYEITGYTEGEIDQDSIVLPRRDQPPNMTYHVRQADASEPTMAVPLANDIPEGNIVRLNLIPDYIDYSEMLQFEIAGFDCHGNEIKEIVWCTNRDNCQTLITDFYYATPPEGKRTTYKILTSGGENCNLTIRSQDTWTQVTFNQQDRELLPGWTLEARKGTIPFTYVGVTPSETSITLARNSALTFDMNVIAYDSSPYKDLQDNEVEKDGSTGFDISDKMAKGYHNFVEASDTLFTGWQAYLNIVEPATVIPIRVPLTEATLSINHNLAQAPLIVGDRRPGPPYRETLREVTLNGTILFTRERDWVNLFRRNADFTDCRLVLENRTVGGFPYKLYIEFGIGQLMNSPDPEVSDIGLITQTFSMKFRETKTGAADDFNFNIITDKWQFEQRDYTVGGLRVDGDYS